MEAESVAIGDDPLAALGGPEPSTSTVPPPEQPHPLAPPPQQPQTPLSPPPPPPPPPPQPYAYQPPPDVVETFLGRPAPPRQHTETSVPQSLEGVLTLAKAGAWRAATHLSERLLAHSHPVDVLLQLRWYHIVALLRLRENSKAEREIALLGDLRSPGYNYEKYPAVYPSQTGSMVPFALHVLHALLPSYSGNHDQALSRLYALLDVETTAAEAERAGGPLPRLAERAQGVLALVNVLCAVYDYPNAVTHLEQLIGAVQQQQPSGAAAAATPPADGPQEGFGAAGEATPPTLTHLLSLLGRLQLQLGNLEAADDAFSRLECLLRAPDETAAVRINRGLLAVANSQYEPALAEFKAALEMEPSSVLAANNLAVCQLYCCHLSEAVGTLESQLKADPKGSMHPTLVANLANLYQMTSPGAAQNFRDAKPTLEKIVQATAADDFDASVLNLGGQQP